MAGEKIINTIRNAAKTPESESAGLVFGKVTSMNPIAIRVDNRFEITSPFILLSGLCTRKTITHLGDTIEIWRGLEVGDNVRMIRVSRGQLFYVIEREGGVT